MSRKENFTFHSTLKELLGSKRLGVSGTKRTILPVRKYPDPVSDINNTVKSYYGNHCKTSFDSPTGKE